ncbi:22960_t:CDS:1, partial [Gigaspora rosea]
MADDNSDYYYNSDIDFETTYTDWEQYGLSEISRTSSDLSAK